MKLSKNLGMLLLGVWLLATGATSLFAISMPNGSTILAVLAMAAGALILLGR